MNMNPSTVAEQDRIEVTPKGDTDFSTVEVSDTVAAINYNLRGDGWKDTHHRC
jgi:hypothetical protein